MLHHPYLGQKIKTHNSGIDTETLNHDKSLCNVKPNTVSCYGIKVLCRFLLFSPQSSETEDNLSDLLALLVTWQLATLLAAVMTCLISRYLPDHQIFPQLLHQ